MTTPSFYSPLVDVEDIKQRADALWPNTGTTAPLGIDFNDAHQKEVICRWFPKYIHLYDYPDEGEINDGLDSYFSHNGIFEMLDSRALLVLLNAWKPKRLLEIGCGMSTILTTDINRRMLNQSMRVACVEPYPPEYLRNIANQIDDFHQIRAEFLPMKVFESLDAGDVLFIDSSHVCKTGSDVNFLFFEVFPRLKSGVKVHIHDVFFPYEYPKQWVLDEHRSWNEQYLLRALLMGSAMFKVLFGCHYAFWRYRDLVISALNHGDGSGYGGGSFWMEKQ